MRIFLAGGTGVIGRRIVPLLLEQGHHVTVMVRNPQRAAAVLPPGTTIVLGDALDPNAVSAAVTAAEPEAMMHQLTDLAALSSESNTQIRVDGTRNLVAAALTAGVDRIVTQSIALCYEPGSTPADETAAFDTAPEDPARRATVDAVISMEADTARITNSVALRNGMFYGPGTWYTADGLYGQAARAGTLTATEDVTSFIHVDDAATAAVAALDWPNGVVNVVDDEPAAGTIWTPVFCAAVGGPPPHVDDRDGRPQGRGATNRYARTLGWTPQHSSWRTGFPTSL